MVEVSVIVANRNYGFYVGRCLRSLFHQSFGQFEIIVVDDCSTDYSRGIYSLWSDSRLRVLYNPHNQGLGASCNIGARAARGRYIVRVDSDDYVHEHFLLCLSLYLNRIPEAHAVACDYYEIENGDAKQRRVDARKQPIACGLMFRSEVLWDIGFYDPTLRKGEDKEIMKQFKKKGFKLGYLPLPLYRYCRHSGSITKGEK